LTADRGWPTNIDGFQIGKHLGSGAYGHTFSVTDAGGAQFALKWLREDPAEGGAKRFENETWALSQLDHPYIPKLIANGTHLGRPYIVMTLASGTSLRAALKRHQTSGRASSELSAIVIAEGVFDALSHMHEHPSKILHRDIKDDNIIVSEAGSKVWLIDLGVCKGSGQPRDDLTFWNAGASRFSPPSKLKNPTLAHSSHDIFSVGVLLYLLLTNRFPWSVGPDADRGHLEELMRSEVPSPIRQLNPIVSRETSDFVARLIDIEDGNRPSALDCRETCSHLRQQLEQRAAPSVIYENRFIKLARVIRDPVHGDIGLTELEWLLIDTPEFQRLRRIKQLGLSNLVYPGAEHSRFSHALGTMHVASRILSRVEERTGVLFDPEERLMARSLARFIQPSFRCDSMDGDEAIGLA